MELENAEALENWALEQFPKDQHGGGESQQILLSWFAHLRKHVDPETARYGQLVSDAINVLTKLQWAFLLLPDPERKRAVRYDLWAWPNESVRLQRRPSEWCEASPTMVGDIDEALAEYVQRPWLQHNVIDASAISALLFSQLAVFAEQVKSGTAFGGPNWSYILSEGNLFKQLVPPSGSCDSALREGTKVV
jgi:hypothetical protein